MYFSMSNFSFQHKRTTNYSVYIEPKTIIIIYLLFNINGIKNKTEIIW